MEESFELLSSMSPKIKGKQKTVKVKKVSRLALKKHFRRSSAFDRSLTIRNEDLSIIEVNTESSESIRSSDFHSMNKADIIESTILEDADELLNNVDKISLSQESKMGKNKIIEQWLEDVNCEKKCETFFSQVSTIYGEEHSNIDRDKIAACSSFNDVLTHRFDELFINKENDDRVSVIGETPNEDSFQLKLTTRVKNKVDLSDISFTPSISENCGNGKVGAIDETLNEDSFNLKTSTQGKNKVLSDSSLTPRGSGNCTNDKVSVIDEIPNEDSFHLKISTQDTDKVDLSDSSFNLIFSENSISNAASEKVHAKKNKTIENKRLSDDSFSLKLDISLKSRIKKQDSPLREISASNKVTHSKTDSDSLRNSVITIEDSPITPIKSNGFVTMRKKEMTPRVAGTPHNQTVEEAASLLDSFYGTQWREKKEKVLLPMSEPKRKNLTKFRSVQGPNTEKVKQRVLKKNLPATKKLNFDKIKKPIQSPWIQKLKGLVDPESEEGLNSSDSLVDNVKTKLNFHDDGDIEEQSIKKLPKKKTGGSTENKENQPLNNLAKAKTKANVRRKSSSSSCSDLSTDDEYDREIEILEIKRKSIMPQKPTKYSFLESLSGSVPLDKCDYSARIFRSQFKQNKVELCNKLFKLYNDRVFKNALPEDTELEWNDKLRKTAGLCYCKKITRRNGIVERKARIALSTKVLDSADRVRDTLIHELCHAATWIMNEVQDGHGPYWKNWAFKAMQAFPELPPIKRCHSYAINSKYTYKCTNCGYSFGRHSKSLDINTKRCGHCFGKFEVLLNKVTKEGTKAVPATPKKEPTGFALFVKENYARYKEPSKKHGDVMKVLGQKFAELKVKNSC